MTQKTVSLAMAAAALACIDPDAYAASTVTTGWVSADNFQDFMGVVLAGDLGTNATLDAKIEQATSAAGAGAKDITGAAITQLTQAGGDSNKQAIIAFSSSDLDANGGYTHFRLSMTVGTATSDAAALVLGATPRFGPASGDDASTVVEIVTV